MNSILFGDRFDFLQLGGGSVNTSAAILACAITSCLWLSLGDRHSGWRWLGLILGVGLSVLLVATKSRGGLIAVGCGVALVYMVTRPRFGRGLLIFGGLAVVAILVYGSVRGVWHRFTYGDDSRSDLWRAGLAMLWDAPGGVDSGNASDFFAQWYQVVGDRRDYLSLINYHLNWLAEHGLAARAAYALAWATLAWLVWPRRLSPLFATAAGVWATFFVAAIFSTTATAWQAWVLPIAWLAAVSIWRIYHRSFAAPRVGCLCAGASLLALIALHAMGWYLSSQQLSTAPYCVRWGSEPARIILYDPNPDVLGGKWGHDLRASGESVYVLYSGVAIPTDIRSDAIWILSGNYPNALPPNSALKIYNMIGTPALFSWLEKQAPRAIDVVLSDSLSRDLRADDWFAWGDKHAANVKLIAGTGVYVPNWMP